ncbi:MAG TPA: hypothetical protein VFM46_16730 [Pseudomonadales bacterium]|nr:hypothetical protein [Pseudomonadales bacterium]
MSAVKYTTQVRRSALRPFVLLALILPFAFLPSTEVQFGGLEFEVPHGWQHEQRNDAMYLFPEKSWETSSASIRLEHGGIIEGDLPEWLSQNVGRYEKDFTIIKRSRSRKLPTDGLRSAAHMLSTLKTEDGQVLYRDYVAAEINGTVELIILQTRSEEAYQTYVQSFHSFLENVEPKPLHTAPQQAANTVAG